MEVAWINHFDRSVSTTKKLCLLIPTFIHIYTEIRSSYSLSKDFFVQGGNFWRRPTHQQFHKVLLNVSTNNGKTIWLGIYKVVEYMDMSVAISLCNFLIIIE
jgi:hypothetical protein